MSLSSRDMKYPDLTRLFARYITRQDESPLMNALVLWRDTALSTRGARSSANRPSSPYSDEDEMKSGGEDEPLSEGEAQKEDGKDLQQPGTAPAHRPTSSSWVRWWSRSGSKKEPSEIQAKPPPLVGSTSKPPIPSSTNSFNSSYPNVINQQPSAIPFPSSKPPPGQRSSDKEKPHRKRYAKTLRLTSDQLVSFLSFEV